MSRPSSGSWTWRSASRIAASVSRRHRAGDLWIVAAARPGRVGPSDSRCVDIRIVARTAGHGPQRGDAGALSGRRCAAPLAGRAPPPLGAAPLGRRCAARRRWRGNAAGLRGPAAKSRGDAAGLSGPARRLRGPRQVERPARRWRGNAAGLRGPAAELRGNAARLRPTLAGSRPRSPVARPRQQGCAARQQVHATSPCSRPGTLTAGSSGRATRFRSATTLTRTCRDAPGPRKGAIPVPGRITGQIARTGSDRTYLGRSHVPGNRW